MDEVLRGSAPHPALAASPPPWNLWRNGTRVMETTHAASTVQDVTRSVWVCFILFYICIFFFGILYIAVGVKIVF